MATRKLERSAWHAYFDAVTKSLVASKVSVLVEGLDLGVQPDVEKLPLEGITYDATQDELTVATEAMDHRISGPTEIWVKEDESGRLESFEVKDGEAHTQIIEIDAVRELPA